MLVIEQDDSLLDWDRRQLYALARETRLPLLRYEHRRASAEQLLAIPDAIAWCWVKGGPLAAPDPARGHERARGLSGGRTAQNPAHQPSG